MKTLLHAAAIVLTVLLLFLQPRCSLAAVCYKKLNIGHHLFQSEDNNLKPYFMNCSRSANLMPRYKKDPEIDDELIGPEPMD